MFISMQGNWTVSVKSKEAAYAQRFIISGATSGNGTYNGIVGTTAHVTGKQWTIVIQNDPGTGFQLSNTKIQNPYRVGGNYQFDIQSNDAWEGDKDYNDLILTCSIPASINDFIIYGHASLYSGNCIFNPCRRRGPLVIDTYPGLLEALKNPRLKDIIEKLYPERIPPFPPIPNPPDPAPFKPIVLDLFNEATQPKTSLIYERIANVENMATTKSKKEIPLPELSVKNFKLVKTTKQEIALPAVAKYIDKSYIAKLLDGFYWRCNIEPAKNITLTFEEYDRTTSELAGGAYTGNGNRQLLGDTITDAYGNYIFRFTFDMEFPGIADSTDVATGEDINVVAYPDIIVKVLDSSFAIQYESAPYYNIPNLKQINLCFPKSSVEVTSTCRNGNLIGSLGNVFIGGNQNSAASYSSTILQRYGYSNYLEADGKISVGSSLAGFNIECAAWGGVIDMKGCMYDVTTTPGQNPIKWYNVRIKRAGSSNWEFVSQNYKHPKFSKRNLPNYIGDDVGPFYPFGDKKTPFYINIQRELFVDGIDWEFSNIDRYMQLNTWLYDLLGGERTPDTFYVRVDGYDAAGNHIPNATDMIALYIHNLPLNVQLTRPFLDDPSITQTDCGLYRLNSTQLNTPMKFSFQADDPYGFVNKYSLSVNRCPNTLTIHVNSPTPSLPNTLTAPGIVSSGTSASTHNTCNGYSGTTDVFGPPAGLVEVNWQPAASEGGWIKSGEYFTILSFTLTANKRVTNGYNAGVTPYEYRYAQILMELI